MSGPWRQRRRQKRLPADARGPVERPRAVERLTGSKLHGASGHELAGGEVARIERLQRMVDHDLLAGGTVSQRTVAIDDVEQLADGNRRGTQRVRALVVAGVGDDQPLGRRQQRVEQQLAVLAARVAIADVRIGRASGRRRRAGACAETRRRRARAGRRPGAGPSASARACRRSDARCGSSRASGVPRSRSASSARTSASSSSRRRAPSPASDHDRRRRAGAAARARCQAVALAGGGERVGGVGDRVGPVGDRLAAR